MHRLTPDLIAVFDLDASGVMAASFASQLGKLSASRPANGITNEFVSYRDKVRQVMPAVVSRKSKVAWKKPNPARKPEKEPVSGNRLPHNPGEKSLVLL